jgi:hypothetical protein
MYFFVFYLMVVLVVCNVVIAYVLTAFQAGMPVMLVRCRCACPFFCG